MGKYYLNSEYILKNSSPPHVGFQQAQIEDSKSQILNRLKDDILLDA